MSRSDRLFHLMNRLQDGQTHLARDLATALGVSERTIYRDMDTLAASGIPVEGARGVGYTLADVTPLPSLLLTEDELNALHLGLAIVSEFNDPDLQAASQTLAQKLEAALPTATAPLQDKWKFATYPFADAARGLSHIPTLRAAIRAHQKLRLTYTSPQGDITSQTVHPHKLTYLGRYWVLHAWCAHRKATHDFRLDLIETAEPLPELFTPRS